MSQLPLAALPLDVAADGVALVHVLIACLYAVTLWLSLLAYLLIIEGPWMLAVVLCPLIISSLVLLLLLMEFSVNGLIVLCKSFPSRMRRRNL